MLNHFPKFLAFTLFVLWLVVVLMAAWGTIPLLSPPIWLYTLLQKLFYRDYLF